MPLIAYREQSFKGAALELIDRANAVITDLNNQGFTPTLRQLYYQLVAANVIANKDTEYKRLGNVLNDARLAGLIDWESMVDRTRAMQSIGHWDSPGQIISAVSEQYRVDKWLDQDERPEVWIEKQALESVIEGVCRELDVSYFCCRGYVSQSSLWESAQRLIGYANAGQETIVLHLGDHDPSGLDMSRDIEDRLTMFMEYEGVDPVRVLRIALNMDQVRQYNPPPNPAKLSDARAAKYVAQYGPQSYELDALTPSVLTQLIRRNVAASRRQDTYDERVDLEDRERALLGKVSRDWQEVARYVEEWQR